MKAGLRPAFFVDSLERLFYHSKRLGKRLLIIKFLVISNRSIAKGEISRLKRKADKRRILPTVKSDADLFSRLYQQLYTMQHGGCVYIMTNRHHTVLYVGVTSDLFSRVVEHRDKKYHNSFTSRYNIVKLVYYEAYPSIEEAITREKEIKKWRREKKLKLINEMNPKWLDRFEEIKDW